ncbi:alpha-D-ribose 1-methylphosphonate 5-triphosphate diphosphatase [Limoniibacter endophyticus]|uniref:Phosphonate metabolism protein PhnM n=1 Tax=Limoniibacter endophyticus TaxID=1565040 RepID=A0A8J3DNN9_9HYPH|nr:alpha-D-ribose 1-methylphosphonate 5-triphosphate diphosphatase [Limoniibacter endophyticus]GHC66889.1 phosphonate metabolism protein PhnM [Limoniibacter endophyticus]
MKTETVLTNARIVLPDEEINGTLVIRNGLIAEIDTGSPRNGEDMHGEYIIPGLVELHTDHLESHYTPRPKVRWNPLAAVQAHDAQIATAGITTVCDALRIGVDRDSDIQHEEIRMLGNAIEDGVRANRLRADHFLHLRCEVSTDNCLEGFRLFENDSRVRLASLMDHAPGQRQFASLDAYAVYYKGKLKMTDQQFEDFCKRRVEESGLYSDKNRKAIAELAKTKGFVLASHDDATIAHVDEAISQGIAVAEFPTTLEAAKASHMAGMGVLMGAPNVVRGGSHSGNIAARELAEEGTLDILSSDYIPFSMIQAAFYLGEVVDGVDLPKAIRMVTKNPAEAIRLNDRGAIEVGRRADLVRVRVDDHVPVVRTVWREGDRVA